MDDWLQAVSEAVLQWQWQLQRGCQRKWDEELRWMVQRR